MYAIKELIHKFTNSQIHKFTDSPSLCVQEVPHDEITHGGDQDAETCNCVIATYYTGTHIMEHTQPVASNAYVPLSTLFTGYRRDATPPEYAPTALNKLTAAAICGGLSKPSKMPGPGYSIPAQMCNVGTILRKVVNSTCSRCYARKGRYTFPAVQQAMERRFATLSHPQWVEAIAYLIQCGDHRHFRWHDSGDLQGIWHLRNIFLVAEACPDVKFWLPTRERAVVLGTIARYGQPPPNLCIRMSATLIDAPPPPWPTTSGVVTKKDDAICKAHTQGNSCGTCRMCWNTSVPHVSYPLH